MPRTDSTTPDEAPPCIAFLIVDGMLTSVPFLCCCFVFCCFLPEDSLTIDSHPDDRGGEIWCVYSVIEGRGG